MAFFLLPGQRVGDLPLSRASPSAICLQHRYSATCLQPSPRPAPWKRSSWGSTPSWCAPLLPCSAAAVLTNLFQKANYVAGDAPLQAKVVQAIAAAVAGVAVSCRRLPA